MSIDYLNHFDIFLDYKSKLLSKKSELQKCNECENNFEIKETSEQIILSCGKDNDKLCGVQFKINIPKYIYKNSDLNELKNKLYYGLNNDGLNHKILHNNEIINESEFKKNNDFINDIISKIKKINDNFEKKFLVEKRILTKKYHDEREKLLNESKDIFYNMKKSEDPNVKIDLRKKYSSIIKEINELTFDFQTDLHEHNYTLTMEDGNVEIINDNYNIQKTKIKSKKVKSTETDISINDFKEGMKVEWKERNKTLNGIVHKINKRKKKKIEIMLDNGSLKEITITKLKIIS